MLESQLDRIRSRGAGRPYDCVVGVSGGRDSSYLLWLLVRQHKLRCLAAYYRTPFTPDVVDANARRAISRMGVPMVEMDISSEQHRKVSAKFCRMWSRHHYPELTNLACSVCKLVNRELFRIAARNKVRCVVLGGSAMESIQFLPTATADAAQIGSLRRGFSRLGRIAGKGLGLLCRCPGVLLSLPLAVKASVLYLNPYTPYLRFRYPNIMRWDYFFSAPWNEAECERVVSEELGWELPKECHNFWRADCVLADVKNIMFRTTYGATYLDCMLSNMVRAGQITRDEALSRVQDGRAIPPVRVQQALDIMGLDRSILPAE